MMAQVNNNAESLSRELRKFKNLKSVDFKGLLSGTPESYVNLYRYLFCENNIGFSQLVIEKGYDLSGLNDYKFMEALYKMMRDFLNTKPPINQNQFFSPGFTQRKLEMSTLIASEVRKITNELMNKSSKKTVQTQSLMKTSLKRPNSAPKPARIIEMGDESENGKSKLSFDRYRKTKSGKKVFDKNHSDRPKRLLTQHNNSQSSDELSDESDEPGSYNSQMKPKEFHPGNNYDVRPKPVVERSDNADSYNQQFRNNFDSRTRPLMDTQKYSSAFSFQKPTTDFKDVSAFETSNSEQPYNNRNNHQERLYDVKQYVPSSHADVMIQEKDVRIPNLEKIMQQFDTVLARITLLEGRMNRIESKLDNSSVGASDRHMTQSLYSTQGNVNNAEYISSYEHNHNNKLNSYSSNKNSTAPKLTRDAIPDFESNHHQPPVRSKMDSDRSYSSSTYSGNYKPHVTVLDQNYSGPRYVTNYSGDKRPQDLPVSNAMNRDEYYNLSATYNGSQPPLSTMTRTANGIPPVHPTATKKTDDLYRDNRRYGGKPGDEKVMSQTDRIASMLSDTQKMLRLSDEEEL